MSYWKNKVIVITGGSAGFGKELAAAFAQEQAHVAVVARDRGRLKSVRDELGSLAHAFVADVTNDEQVADLRSSVLAKFGRVDALVNCVGKSTRGPIAETTPANFLELFELNFLTAARCTRVFLADLQDSRGHVVNIGSLATKSASTFLGAYPVSKFPLAAYSQQLRLELGDGPRAVHVLLVCPGPIARADAGVRYGGTDVPEAARQPGGGVKLKGLDPQKLASRVLKACERRQLELIIPAKARILFVLSQCSARLGDWLVRKMTRR